MSVAIWPPLSAADLKTALEDTQRRELEWLLNELHDTLQNLKHGLEDCYALLAPIDPGSTLVVSTPRNEAVKGHITRVGTRIVKGTLSLRLRTAPPQTLSLDPDHPIHLAPLTHLHTLLTDALDVLTQTLAHLPKPGSEGDDRYLRSPNPGAAAFVSAQLRLLSASLAEASAVLKGPPVMAPDPAWTTLSAAPSHFLPPAAPPPSHNPLQSLQSSLPFSTSSGDHHNHNPSSSHAHHHGMDAAAAMAATLQNVSVYFGIQESALVLWVRALEPADAPVSVGMKFALAIGTARRLEHDESERVFGYCCAGLDGRPAVHGAGRSHGPGSPTSLKRSISQQFLVGGNGGGNGGGAKKGPAQVYVREKIRVESADPSLLSLSAKLGALSNTLSIARRNLAAVLGEEMEE
ncbi:hypothetical protein GGTG_11821 [Gaeumannomyces tritici R3-111a-1]|uniref:37S ribosomal protein Rsm22 n=1 Tax=Gaeumannomyces tritici (strain R3-111a-1) TaxID=644352 RepID=J3PE98_GAET3|nr:hypothetical protein GGTG_11821 [Gaeumannomyces tritici R3-111a-1]EJT70798.1 hypothetical protein GGTG_11821 [Gaeumannomyces tritici R3-111a-1]